MLEELNLSEQFSKFSIQIDRDKKSQDLLYLYHDVT